MAIGKDGAIGRGGDLIWKIPADLKRFKALTTGNPVIMGRKTWDSLPKRPLPNRRNIIVTRQKDFKAEGAETVNSIEEALRITESERPFIIGGAQIYKEFLPYANELYLTLVDEQTPDADSFLPLTLFRDWEKVEESEEETTPDGIRYRYVRLRKE